MENTRDKDVYFRVGSGMVIYKQNKSVCMFQRVNDAGLVRPWQFPQGGIEIGESPEDALWREAKEEIGLERTQVNKVTAVSDSICYQYGRQASHPDSHIGRCNYWFFLRVPDDFEINLDNATENEFTRYEWVTIDEAANRAQDNFHKGGYSQLVLHFKKIA